MPDSSFTIAAVRCKADTIEINHTSVLRINCSENHRLRQTHMHVFHTGLYKSQSTFFVVLRLIF